MRSQVNSLLTVVAIACWLLLPSTPGAAQTPITFKPPKPSAQFDEVAARAEEPLAKEFSLEKAARSLDAGAINFSQKHRCVQCHANLMYLTARPTLDKVLPSPPDMRAFHEWIVDTRWPQFGVIYDAWSKDQPAYQERGSMLPGSEPIIVAFGLATHDRATTGKLHATTRAALDKVLERQRPDGGFNVVSDGLGSFLNEFDQTMLAAIAVGAAPDDYAASAPAQKFLVKLKTYIASSPPQNPYQRGMLVWAATRIPDLIPDIQRASLVSELRRLQRPDGGWCLAELLTDRADEKTGKYANERPSDGYGSGFAIFAMRNASVPAMDPAIMKGVAWLKANQRESGRWFQPTFVNRPGNLISNSATAWAVLALNACTEDPTAQRITAAKTLLSHLAAAKYDQAVTGFDATMTKVLPADKLRPIWESVLSQYGPFQRAEQTRTEAALKYQVVFVTAEFERGQLNAKVVFDAENRIAGLFFEPAGKYQSPPYVKTALFDEAEISIGKGLLPLPGTLSVPKGDGPFPAVILVHGSGPHDRDETIGPNKPFRDLAQGLASQGIAVLRYEKRTKAHPLAMSLMVRTLTVKEEVVDDAAAAVDFLSARERIDGRRIFVLGHSLGGMLLPRIGKSNEKIAGFISLAGTTRPMEDIILEQTNYLLSLNGPLTPEKQQQIKQLEEQVARVKSASLSPKTAASELPLGVPASYWLDLRDYDPAHAAADLKQPMLILQGERDYQVTMKDFERWKEALGAQARAKFIVYPDLNHLFMTGKGPPAPVEYLNPGNVAESVITDIADWISTVK